MIICDLHFVRIAILPSETDPILLVDTNAVLPRPISTESLQPVSWGEQPTLVDRSPDSIGSVYDARQATMPPDTPGVHDGY